MKHWRNVIVCVFLINFLTIQTRETMERPAWGGGGRGRDREREGPESVVCCRLWEGVPVSALEGVGVIGGGGAKGEVDGAEEGDGGVADGVGAKVGVSGFEVGAGAWEWWDGGEEVGDGDLVGDEASADPRAKVRSMWENRGTSTENRGSGSESEECGWVGFSNFYFYSLISLIEIYLV